MKKGKLVGVFFLIFLFIPFPLFSEEIKVFYSSISQKEEIIGALKKYCNCPVTEKPMDKEKVEANSVVLGERNLKLTFGEAFKFPVLLLLTPSPYHLDNSEITNSVIMYPEPKDVLNLFKKLTEKRRIAFPYSYGVSEDYMRKFRMIFEKENFIIFPIPAGDPSGVFVRVKQIEDQIEIIFYVYDPVIITPDSFIYISNYSRQKKFILVSPTLDYLKIGGDIAFQWSSDKLGALAYELYKKMLKGETGTVEYAPVGGCIIPSGSQKAFSNPSLCRIE